MLYLSDTGNGRLVFLNESDLSYISEVDSVNGGLDKGAVRYSPITINTSNLVFIPSQTQAAVYGVYKGVRTPFSFTQFNILGDAFESSLTGDKSFIYRTDNTNQNVLHKYDFNGVSQATAGFFCGALTTDGTYIWTTFGNTHSMTIRLCSSLGSTGTTRTFLNSEIGYYTAGVTTDGKFVYIVDTGIGANQCTIVKLNMTTLATVASGTTTAVIKCAHNVDSITTDGSFIYVPGSGSNNVGKFDINTLNLVASVSSGNGAFLQPQSVYTDKWFDLLFGVAYQQISGGSSGKRYKPHHGLYTPYQDPTYP